MSSPFAQAQFDQHAALAPQLPGARLPWLAQLRAQNLAAFAAAGLPDARNEHWKYTALRSIEQRALPVADAQAKARVIDSTLLDLPLVESARLVFVNGAFRPDLSHLALPSELQGSISVTPLGTALEHDAEGLSFFLSRHFREPHEGFARLNTAFAADGAVIRIALGARIEAPIRLVFVGTGADSELAWYARNLLELGEGAQANVIEQYLAAGRHANLGNVVNQVSLKRGASLRWLRLQEEHEAATLIVRSEFALADSAALALHTLELGGAMARHDVVVDLAGQGAALRSRGVFALHARQHGDTQFCVSHAGRDTSSDLLWRGIADGRARGVFNGSIVVEAGADGSDARLTNKNLLLSPHAEIDTKPVLEIHADEVKASHGATVGQLDERALFYLRSRGVPLAKARSMLTYGFCREVLDGIEPTALREHLAQRLLDHLPKAVEA
jgi:Fe-S cluster assembly protein SufD